MCEETGVRPKRAPAAPSAAPAAEAGAGGERRESERRGYARRVIALGDDAPRVLICRDLSLGGLRVESGVPLAPGQRLRLALHVRAGEVPLVVEAEVVRAGAEGSGLRFEGLSETSRDYLAKMLDALPALPALATPSATSGEERRVLVEVVEG
jgi:hypothetical protein